LGVSCNLIGTTDKDVLASKAKLCYTFGMKILGIDPGSTRVGWAVIEIQHNKPVPLAYDCIMAEEIKDEEKRLLRVYQKITEIIKMYVPDELAIESLFFTSNAKTAISVAQSRGTILLAAAQQNIRVVSYTPTAIKQCIAGNGKADKRQVQKMVGITLHLPRLPSPDDTVDALAIALTHTFSYKIKSLDI
jgi:crossover junction endodeoxyribonuclease RuvC